MSRSGKENYEVFITSAVCSTLAGHTHRKCRSEVLMQEEVTQKTIALVIKTAKLDANVLKAAMRMYF